jgi:hypothetical protein
VPQPAAVETKPLKSSLAKPRPKSAPAARSVPIASPGSPAPAPAPARAATGAVLRKRKRVTMATSDPYDDLPDAAPARASDIYRPGAAAAVRAAEAEVAAVMAVERSEAPPATPQGASEYERQRDANVRCVLVSFLFSLCLPLRPLSPFPGS